MSSRYTMLRWQPRAWLAQQKQQQQHHYHLRAKRLHSLSPSSRPNASPAARISNSQCSSYQPRPQARSVSSLTRRPWRPTVPSRASSVAQIQITRGAKRSTTISLSSLPQGPLEDMEPLPPVEPSNGPEYSAMYAQVRANMNKFSSCVLLTRVGGFYELYFEHAEEVGPLLSLKVGRKKMAAGVIAMAGFPVFQLDRILKQLVQELNYHVAISEEFQNLEKANPSHPAFGLMFDRRVSRIITRGTLIDEKFMDPYENNFLLSVAPESDRLTRARREVEGEAGADDVKLGLAWLDLSTGDFFTQESALSVFASDLARIGPREVILGSDMKRHIASLPDMQQQRHLITFLSPSDEAAALKQKSSVRSWTQYFQAGPQDEATAGAEFSEAEVSAGWNLLGYVEEKLQGLTMKLQPPMRRAADDNVFIDANTMRSLEVKQTLQEGVAGGRGSLIKEVRRTVTKSGARKLTTWLTSPETSIRVINDRLNLVELFLNDPKIREVVQHQLRLSYDSLRLLQKLTLGRGDADDLLELAKTIDACKAIHDMLRKLTPDKPEMDTALTALINRLEIPTDISKLIATSIDEDGLMLQQRIDESAQAEAADEGADAVDAAAEKDVEPEGIEYGETATKAKARVRKPRSSGRLVKAADREKFEAWIMRREASPMLQVQHESLEKQMHERAEMEKTIRDQLEIPSLTLRWTPMLGHIVHLRSKNKVTLYGRMREAKLVSSNKSTQSFHLPEWAFLGSQIEVTRMQIRAEEQRVLAEIRNKVLAEVVPLRRNAAVLDEIDIACSFAVLAEEQKLVRPILNMGATFKIIGGRHLVVEEGLQRQGRTFIANDCLVGEKERIWLITGPNMAGKSTFLRQNALISILAQVGSFVPAEYAEIGIVDKIFSRVGSADNLYRDQSTFKVEMNETTTILKHATPRSFVIMDEVGRGTTPSDGIAIAYGTIHHLHNINRSRCLFATHFHVLAELAKRDGLKGLGCYCTDVVEVPPGGKLSDIGIREQDVITIGEDGQFAYVHKLKKGINTRSHAIKVARMAGLPEEAIKVAERVLEGSYKGIDTLLPKRAQDGGELGEQVEDADDNLWDEPEDTEMSGHLEKYISEMEMRHNDEGEEATAVGNDAIEYKEASEDEVNEEGQAGDSVPESDTQEGEETNDDKSIPKDAATTGGGSKDVEDLDLENLRYMYPNSFPKYEK